MSKFAENIKTLCETASPYCWALAVVSFLVIGVMFIIPSEESHAKAKKALPYVFLGCLLILGAVTLGKWITNTVTF